MRQNGASLHMLHLPEPEIRSLAWGSNRDYTWLKARPGDPAIDEEVISFSSILLSLISSHPRVSLEYIIGGESLIWPSRTRGDADRAMQGEEKREKERGEKRTEGSIGEGRRGEEKSGGERRGEKYKRAKERKNLQR